MRRRGEHLGAGAPPIRGRTLAIVLLVGMLAALVFSIAGSAAGFVQSNHVAFTLQGCRNDGSITFPANGPFVCDDSDYTTGNLGKGWNELDLVPHRLTTSVGTQADATTDYNVLIAGDHFNGGTKVGYDVISAPVVNATLSNASCSVSATAQAISAGVTGGAQDTISRTLTIHQNKGTTCVFDYYQRLALGAAGYSGSSLQSYMFEKDDFSTGKRTVSIPVNQIAPQKLSKDMTATQGSDHIWTIKKEPSAAHVDLGDTCDPSNPLSAPVTIKVSWEKLAANPTGPITVVTHVYATNPSARVVTLNLSDDIRSGTTVLDTATAGPIDLPANSITPVLTHTTEEPAGTTDLNDVATGTYTDKFTGIAIPGSTTATASASVQSSGPEANQTATINDLESITGSGFSYSADSFSGASGAFDNGYVAGTATTSNVGWTSDTQTGDSSVTFSKTIYTTAGSSGSGDLADTATLTGSNGFTTSANADISISSSATVTLTINKSIPDVLQNAETDTFNFAVYDSGDNLVASPSISFSAGQTSKHVDVTGLAPDTYTVKETSSASGKWNLAADQVKTISLPSCSGSVSFSNNFGPAAAKVKKVTVPSGHESGWDMTLTGPGTPVGGEKVTTSGTGFVDFLTSLQEGSYTITETPQTGWDQTASSGCSFTVNYPANSGTVFSCTFTNTERGNIVIRKITVPSPDPSDKSFSFSAGGGLSPSSFSLKNGGSQSYLNILPGSGYSAAETVPTGWDLTSATCDDSSPVSNINVSPGETVTCTFTNTARGKAKVIKTFMGLPPSGAQQVTFQLRQGASALLAGTILESLTANSANGGVLNFTTLLVPGNSYQLCEVLGPLGPGWTTTLGPPLYSVYNPSGDNSTVCTNFTVAAEETKTFSIDNKPPPGGLAFTIGYWKNWSSCTGGGQKPTLDQTLLKMAQNGNPETLGLLILNPITRSASQVCKDAVSILNKQTLSGKKMSSDPLFNMAAQLLAADLNVGAGAGQCGASATAINQAHALLTSYSFDGNTYTPKLSSADASLANSLATTLDKYNNNKLC